MSLMSHMEPHDEKTPLEVIKREISAWVEEWQPGHTEARLAEIICESLTHKAYFEENESALRWIDPDGAILDKLRTETP